MERPKPKKTVKPAMTYVYYLLLVTSQVQIRSGSPV
jgi:hypothetical protein